MFDELETRVMGLDFGMKRIGIALSDSLKMFAYTHKTIFNNHDTFNELKDLINEKNY